MEELYQMRNVVCKFCVQIPSPCHSFIHIALTVTLNK